MASQTISMYLFSRDFKYGAVEIDFIGRFSPCKIAKY